jgi:asparagine synthase (glutamine-hydrolysing)
MCGIGGKLFFDLSRKVDPSLLEAMNKVLAHRGPDDAGIYHEGPVGLAHRRLSIIDLSPAGHQPMSNPGGTLWITYNGEIYNFLELRQALEGQGVVFRSKTDTEVILALYERHGVDCLRYLRGMFALAIWDWRNHTLFLARDRLGKKPLYYYHDPEKFLFASEPKGILQDPEVPVAADLEAIHHYLSFGYVPSPYSAFRGFRKLPPAHYVLVRDGKLHLERYWRLSYRPKLHTAEAALCEELLAHLREVVRLRMISDVPLGAFLSGGIDSSAVVALMSERSSRAVKTFSIGFEEEAYNELSYARLVADRYGTDHHEFIVKPDAVAILPDLVWHYNEPYADSSAIATYYLAKMTREHVTVALNGDAGDENFAGYERYFANQLAARYDQLPSLARRPLEWGVRALPEVGPFRGIYRRTKRFFAAIREEPKRRYARWIVFFPNALKAELYTRAFREAAAGSDSIELLLATYAAVNADDFVDATLGVDVAHYLPDDLLVKVDIASMAHSLEARSPMVDHVFMEFAASIPSGLKLRGGSRKYIFKRAVRGLLPDAVIDRPKMGFGVPIDRWFRRELREMAYDTLLARRCRDRGLFEVEAVRRLLDEHMTGRAEWHPHLWALLFLELWFQRFIDGRGASHA